MTEQDKKDFAEALGPPPDLTGILVPAGRKPGPGDENLPWHEDDDLPRGKPEP
jgi:hypothetical protein